MCLQGEPDSSFGCQSYTISGRRPPYLSALIHELPGAQRLNLPVFEIVFFLDLTAATCSHKVSAQKDSQVVHPSSAAELFSALAS